MNPHEIVVSSGVLPTQNVSMMSGWGKPLVARPTHKQWIAVRRDSERSRFANTAPDWRVRVFTIVDTFPPNFKTT